MPAVYPSAGRRKRMKPALQARLRPARGDWSVSPPGFDQLPVPLVARAEGKQLDAIWAALEGADHAGGDTNRVEALELEDVVVELHPARAGDDDVDLLGLLVAVSERLTLP